MANNNNNNNDNTVEDRPMDTLPIEYTEKMVSSIINYNIAMPVCNYSPNSRRCQSTSVLTKDELYDQLMVQLSLLDGWSKYPEIAIDGQNGTTKSSIAKNLNRKYLKINEICPKISCGSDYNHRPLKALDYILYQLLVESENSIWDRCVYSNLIFYYVHHLMSHFANTSIPLCDDVVWPVLNTMAMDTGLLETLQFTMRIKHVPTIFLVCSNVDLIGQSLRFRGLRSKTLNDIWNSKEYNYQMAQYHVYRWFGKLMKYPTFDIVDFFKCRMTVDDIQILIASKINTPKKNPNDDNVKFMPDPIKYDNFENIISMFNDDVLIYEHSRK